MTVLLRPCLRMQGQPIDGLTGASLTRLSRSSILGAAYGIAWLHTKLGCPNPVDDPLISQTLAGLKRLLARPSKNRRLL